MSFSLDRVPMRKILAIAALGAAGFFGLAACGAGASAALQRPSATPAGAWSAASPDSSSAARHIARTAVGNGGLAALDDGDGQASLAVCDAGTVQRRPGLTSASCGINYADGSVWRQAVTVTFDRHGNPVADSANLGTEILPPSAG
jgi:hypothetical protein